MLNKKETRKGKRAPGMTMMGVPMSEALKAEITQLAKKSNRPAAAWARLKLQEFVRRSKSASRGLEAVS